MPYNVSRGLRSRTQVLTLTSAEAYLSPSKVVGASSRHVAKTSMGIPASMEERQIPHLEAVARAALRNCLRSASEGSKAFRGL